MDVDKFNWAQMFNNSKGKTSGMLVICFYAGIVSVSCFALVGLITIGASVYAMIAQENFARVLPTDILNFLNNIMFQSLALFGSAAAGYGARRFTKDKDTTEETTHTDDTKSP